MKNGIISLIVLAALVTAGSPAQRSRVEAPEERTAETAAKAVRAFFSAVRSGKSKTAAKYGEEIIAHGVLAVEPLLDGVTSRSHREVVYALRAMGHLKQPATRDTVLELCAHENAEIRTEAIVAGCRAHPAHMTPILTRGVRDENHMVRRRAFDGILALPVNERQAFVDVAFDAILDDDFWVRSRGFRIIGSAQAAPKVGKDPVLVGAARVTPKLTKDAAIPFFRTMTSVRRDDMADVIDLALRAGSVHAKVAAFGAAGDLRQRDHVGSALRQMKSRDTEIAKAATKYLGKVRDRKSVRPLVDLLGSTRNEERREVIAVALRQITGRPFGYDVDAWLDWLDKQG